MRYPGKEILNLPPGEVIFINTQIAMEIPNGTYCQIKSRSSLAKKSIDVKAGTIDAGYTGDIGILLFNSSKATHQIQPNERIAQAIFMPLVNIAKLKEVQTREELGKTDRGQDSFGSTGTTQKLKQPELQTIIEDDDEYEDKNLEDQLLLKILEEIEQQTILDIEIYDHYAQIKDQQIYHSTVDEWKTNQLNDTVKCPHFNDKTQLCLICQSEEELIKQLEIIPKVDKQIITVEDTNLILSKQK